MIAIKPITLQSFPSVVTADRCEVLEIAVLPDKQSASGKLAFGVEETDADGNARFVPLQSGMTVAMTPAQYAAWGTDDSYAINCLLDNIGIVKT